MTQEEFDGMKQELAMFQLNQLKTNATTENHLGVLTNGMASIASTINNLTKRIEILEEARQRQIQVNADVQASIKAGHPTKESWIKKLIK